MPIETLEQELKNPKLQAALASSWWSEEEAELILSALERSGLTVREFAKRTQVGAARLYSRRQQQRSAATAHGLAHGAAHVPVRALRSGGAAVQALRARANLLRARLRPAGAKGVCATSRSAPSAHAKRTPQPCRPPSAVPSAAAESDASGSPTLCQSGTALGARPSGISRRTGQGDSQCRAIYSLVTPAAPAIVRGPSKLRNARIFDDKRPKKCFQKSFPKYSFSHMSLLQNRSESLPSSSLPV
jgi:hypothetical protein